MATVRAVADVEGWSLSRGVKDYFACCFVAPAVEKTPGAGGQDAGNMSSKTSDVPDGKPATDGPKPPPRVTKRVRCKRQTSTDDDDDDVDDTGRPLIYPGGRRLEADGASVHSSGTDRSGGGRPSGQTDAVRDGLHAVLSTAAAEVNGERCRTESGGTDAGIDLTERNHTGVGSEDDMDVNGTDDRLRFSENLEPAGSEIDARSTSSANMGISVREIAIGRDLLPPVGMDRVNDDDPAAAGSTGDGSERVFVDEDQQSTSKHSVVQSVRFSDANGPGEPEATDADERREMGLTSCGKVHLIFLYDPERRRLNLEVREATELPAADRGGATHTQVHVMLLPAKKLRHKTRVKPGNEPKFQEKFDFKLQPGDDLMSMGLRVRLYGVEKLKRERMIGESIVSFPSLDLESGDSEKPQPVDHWVKLDPRSNISHNDPFTEMKSKLGSGANISADGSDCGSSALSLQHGGAPELMLGLAYNETTGRLSVEVIKGSNFKNLASSKQPDTSVKLALMSPKGSEVTRTKTSVRRGQPNPLFKETFMFQVPQTQLSEVSLLVSVYATRGMKRKEMVGWFTLGMTNSSEEEKMHWTSMCESRGEQVCRWHLLLEP